jgi:hypothetical protein
MDGTPGPQTKQVVEVNGELGVGYLIHFEERIGADGRNGAQHYIGWTSDLDARMESHRKGHGARIMAHLKTQGIGWQLVRIYENWTRDDERRRKNVGHYDRDCPECRAEDTDLVAAYRQAVGSVEPCAFEKDLTEDSDWSFLDDPEWRP